MNAWQELAKKENIIIIIYMMIVIINDYYYLSLTVLNNFFVQKAVAWNILSDLMKTMEIVVIQKLSCVEAAFIDLIFFFYLFFFLNLPQKEGS